MKTDAKDLFVHAHELDGDARDAYLREACGEDAELRLEVQRLLVKAQKFDSFFRNEEGTTVCAQEFGEIYTEREGDLVGPYTLRQQIGEGGFGAVWMAEQNEPISRMVALKVVKAGMDSKQVLARFEAERQALALMDHPNIAKVLDAGATSAGRPYFAMELVKGIPITQFCNQQKFGPRRRLELFRDVCAAVQHAHQKGIIHRDLKPSNVMVTLHGDKPVVKVIDFGIAKAMHSKLTEKTLFTRFEQFLGTPVYMSPEQAAMSGLDIDTRSDIYSLGVLLYELLAGSPPFDQKSLLSAGYDEMRRIIKEDEPPKPSKRLTETQARGAAEGKEGECHVGVNALKGDLDWIVMQCLEKDRSRRYQTANELGEDVERHLCDEPVLAGPPSARYRLQKFVRRNRAQVALGALVTTVLLLALIGTSVGMLWAMREHTRARGEFKIARDAKVAAEEAKRTSDHGRYLSDIPRANVLLNEAAKINAREILRSTPADFRNFEWGWLVNRAWQEYSMDLPETGTEASPVKSARFWASGQPVMAREFFPWKTPGGLHGGFFSPDSEAVYFYHSSGETKAFSLASTRQTAMFSTDPEPAIAIDLSPSGRYLAAFTFSNRAVVWDVRMDREIARTDDGLSRPSPWVARWSPDEQFVVTGHMDGVVRIWEINSREVKLQAECKDSQMTDVRSIWFPPATANNESPTTFWTASNDGTIRRWTLPEGKKVGKSHRLRIDGAPVQGALEFQAISPRTGRHAVTMMKSGLCLLWDIESETVVSRLSEPVSDPYSGQIRTACAFSPDGSCVAVMTGSTTISIYQVPTGTPIATIVGRGADLDKMSFSHDGRLLLATSEDGRARIWSTSHARQDRFTHAHGDVILQIDHDPAGELLLTGSYDQTASIWSLPGMQLKETYTGHESQVIAVDLSPSGTSAATLDATGAMHVWNVRSGEQIFRVDPGSDGFSKHVRGTGGGLRSNMLNFPAPLTTGIFSPDGQKIVAFQDDAMRVFNAQNGEVEAVLAECREAGWPVYSKDSSLVAVLGMNARTAGVWDLDTGQLRHRIAHRSPLVMMDFSPGDHRIVTAGMENDIHIWDALTGEELHVLKGNAGNVMSCRFSEDGFYVLAGHSDSTARIWNSRTGELVTTLAGGHSQRLRDVRLNPDKTRLLTWAMDDKAIVWDLAGPKAHALLEIEGPAKLLQARWTSGGRDIVLAWSDGKVEVVRGATREDVLELPGQALLTDHDIQEWRRKFTNGLHE